MRELKLKYFIIVSMSLCTVMCRKPYEPAAIKASNHFLAADGVINTAAYSPSRFILSRSLNLLDSVTDLPELGAEVLIQSADGASFPLIDTGANGIYVSAPLTLDPSQKYRLAITTNTGNKYLSDAVTPKTSPPIDSLNWQLAMDANLATEALHVFVNAHDPTNNTRYYRWEYVETWQNASPLETFWGLKNGLEYPIFTNESTHNCWSTGNSTAILLGSSINLSSDVISQALIASFAKDDPKMDIEYSILVKQYPLDLEAYNYWLTVQKNSQSLGGLFDVQPAQINGNIHGVTNPKDPVVGFVSASSIQEQRMFISNKNLPGWKSNPIFNCPITLIGTDPNNALIWNYPDTSYQLYYFVSGPPPIMKITYKNCLDCRYNGGTNIKPPFWQ